MQYTRTCQPARSSTRPALAPLAVAVALFSPVAGAGIVPYRGGVELTGASTAGRPELAGTVIEERMTQFLLLSPRFDRDYDLLLHNYVVREDATGTLDFYYQFTNDSEQTLALVDMDTGRFTRADSFDPIDVDFRVDDAGRLGPQQADRGRSRFGGVVVGFGELAHLAPGETSQLFFIRTSATAYELGGVTQFRSTPGSNSGNGFAPTFNPVLDGPLVPVPAVSTPEPEPLPVAVPLPSAWHAVLAGIAATAALPRLLWRAAARAFQFSVILRWTASRALTGSAQKLRS